MKDGPIAAASFLCSVFRPFSSEYLQQRVFFIATPERRNIPLEKQALHPFVLLYYSYISQIALSPL